MTDSYDDQYDEGFKVGYKQGYAIGVVESTVFIAGLASGAYVTYLAIKKLTRKTGPTKTVIYTAPEEN